MNAQSDSFREVLKDLPTDDYYKAIVAVEEIRLKELREEQRYYLLLSQLKSEYLENRQEIIGKQNNKEYLLFRNKQQEAIRALERKIHPDGDSAEEYALAREKIDVNFQEFLSNLSISDNKLMELRQAYSEKRMNAYYETIGKGKKSESMGGVVSDPQADPCTTPSFLGWINCGGTGLVEEWHNNSRGMMGGVMFSQLYDCGENDDRHTFYHSHWLMAPHDDTITGRVLASIDLNPSHLHSAISVRDEFGISGVHVNRHFRPFAQMWWPRDSGRIYWNEADNDQMISNVSGVATTGGASYFLPFWYHEEGARLHSFDHSSNIADIYGVSFNGTPQGDETWRYQVFLPGTIRPREIALVSVGIDFYNSVWGDECTVDSTLTFEFLTPQICYQIV